MVDRLSEEERGEVMDKAGDGVLPEYVGWSQQCRFSRCIDFPAEACLERNDARTRTRGTSV